MYAPLMATLAQGGFLGFAEYETARSAVRAAYLSQAPEAPGKAEILHRYAGGARAREF